MMIMSVVSQTMVNHMWQTLTNCGWKYIAWSGLSHKLIMKHLPTCMGMQKDIPKLHAQPQRWQGFEHWNFCWDSCSLFQIIWYTYRLQANLTLTSTLFLCRATSINMTASSFSAAAVFSIRSPQWLPSMCISSEERQHMTLANDLPLTF